MKKLFSNLHSYDDGKKYFEDICKQYGITNYTINPDGSVDVAWNVNLYYRNLPELPLKFNTVSGYFFCNNNNLVNLNGSPNEVGRNFHCEGNQLTSLQGSPKKVVGHFVCNNNKITSLKGIGLVGGNIYCRNNPLHISELLDIDIDFKQYRFVDNQTMEDWLQNIAVGTDEEKMLFKLRYL